MKKFALGRGLSAVAGLLLVAASNPATAESLPASTAAVDATAKSMALLKPATAAVASPSPEDFATLIAGEGRRWGALAQRAGAVAE